MRALFKSDLPGANGRGVRADVVPRETVAYGHAARGHAAIEPTLAIEWNFSDPGALLPVGPTASRTK